MATTKDRERSRSHGSRERDSVKRSASGSEDTPSPALGALQADEPDPATVLGPGGTRLFGRPLRALLAEQRAAASAATASKSPAKGGKSLLSPRVLSDVGNLLLLEPARAHAGDAAEKPSLEVAAIYNEELVPALVLQLFDFIRRKGTHTS